MYAFSTNAVHVTMALIGGITTAARFLKSSSTFKSHKGLFKNAAAKPAPEQLY